MIDFPGAKDHLIDLLQGNLNWRFYYHNTEHALDVLFATSRLCEFEKISGREKLLIETAALYHDVGIIERLEDHESNSVRIVQEVLPQFHYTPEDIGSIAKLILATRFDHKPCVIEEQIICDADMDYLGRDDFFIHSFRLQLEWRVMGIKKTTLEEWLVYEQEFLESHRYHTKSAKMLRDEGKRRIISEIKKICFNLKNP
jgi:hypothetical protein